MKSSLNILLAVTVGVLLLLLLRNPRPRETVRYERTVDTLILRDTVLLEVPKPYAHEVYRIDTVVVYLPAPSGAGTASGDTTRVSVPIPIERKTYRTDDYLAVVEGYRPRLVAMTLYRQTRYITDIRKQTLTRHPRWGIGIQIGYGMTPERIHPYIGIGLQYNLWSW